MHLPFSADQVQEKRHKLEMARLNLRLRFVGIDQIIDGVIHAISSWYCFPDLQERCLVINLWGMTGTGKTSLVQELVKELELGSIYNEFEMRGSGKLFQDTDRMILEAIETANGGPFVFAFDEFQHFRGHNGKGDEVLPMDSNLVWQLIGNPVFQPAKRRYGQETLRTVIAELEWLIEHGVKVEKGLVMENTPLFREFCAFSENFSGPAKENLAEEGEKGEAENMNQQFSDNTLPFPLIPRTLVKNLVEYCDMGYRSNWELKTRLMEFDAPETLAFLRESYRELGSGKKYSSAAGLVFLIGNLDDAYAYSDSLSFEDDPDFHYQNTINMSVATIRRALQNRFRPEQIARMGNNFFFYPALSRSGYDRIIRQELEKIVGRFKDITGINMRFKDSVVQMLHQEAVQPSMGCRPVFASIQRWIESCMGLWILGLGEAGTNLSCVDIRFAGAKLLADYIDREGKKCYMTAHKPAGLQRVHLKVPKDNLQASVAVHEAGHAVMYMVLMGKVPQVVHSWLPHNEDHGFVRCVVDNRTPITRQALLKQIVILLGGMAAESLVFGKEELGAGCSDDLRRASNIAASMVKRHGMEGKPYHIELPTATELHVLRDAFDLDIQARHLLDDALKMTTKILKEHEKLLLELAWQLSAKPMVKEKAIKKILSNHPLSLMAFEEAGNRTGHREVLKQRCGLNQLDPRP